MPAWRPILPGAGPPTAFIFSWPCWPTTSTAGCCCSSERNRRRCRAPALQHTTLAIARLRFLFLAAKVWRHAGRVGVSYSDQYAERGLFQRLMDRLRTIAPARRALRPYYSLPYDCEPCIISYALVALNRQQLGKTEQSTKREDESVSNQYQAATTMRTENAAGTSDEDRSLCII